MTEISYKVFHDAIEAQGSTLLRVPLVSMRRLLLYFAFHYPLSQELDDVSVLHSSYSTMYKSCVKS